MADRGIEGGDQEEGRQRQSRAGPAQGELDRAHVESGVLRALVLRHSFSRLNTLIIILLVRPQGLLGRAEYHAFEAAGACFVYLVPSAAIFRLDAHASAVLEALGDRLLTRRQIADTLADRFTAAEVEAGIEELLAVRAIAPRKPPEPARIDPPRRIPLTTLVLNVTSKCNLACTYCYEYGEDKIVDTAHGAQPKFMSEETAREMAVGALRKSGAQVALAVTGIAGPAGGSADKPVGMVCFAWAIGSKISSETRRFDGDRESVRRQSALRALEGVLERL